MDNTSTESVVAGQLRDLLGAASDASFVLNNLGLCKSRASEEALARLRAAVEPFKSWQLAEGAPAVVAQKLQDAADYLDAMAAWKEREGFVDVPRTERAEAERLRFLAQMIAAMPAPRRTPPGLTEE